MEQLINDDCLNVLKDIPNGSVDMILTDPPYFISKDSNFSKGGGDEKKYGMINIDFGEWDKGQLDFNEIFIQYKRILSNGGTIIMFYDIFKVTEIYNIALKCGFNQPRIGIWQKTNAVPINAKINYLSNSREYFISFCKGNKKTFNSYYNNAIYNFPIVGGKEKTPHPTQKPISLIYNLIETHTNEGDTILDNFMGSGTTGVACIKAKRNFIGIELDEKYFNIAKKRIEIEKAQQSLF